MRFSISLKWDAKLKNEKKKDKKKEKYLSGLFLSSQALFTLELLSDKGAVRVKSLFHKRALIQSSL